MVVVAVIGGAGRMGIWFASFLSANGYRVIICDKNVSAARSLAKKHGFKFVKSPTQAAQLSEIVLLATPALATESLLKKIASHTAQAPLLVEISSIKEPVKKTIRTLTRRGTKIMSIHPMFGPGARSLTGKSIIVTHEPRNCAPARKLLSILSKRGGKIIRCSLEDHDQFMATTLALPHLMNFAFIDTVRQAGLTLDKARAMGGTTFELQLLIAEALYHENPRVEASILADNRKHNRKTFASFVQQIDQVRDIIERKTTTELLRRFRSDAAYVRKNKLFSTAHERFIAAVEASTSCS
ncbi:MAG TPA: prephenate dehydrogenase/arogenate dehydrogenase family protein [Candidatus Dormibacteraeota bacterium]|nr:prephenate dehydrogenase/arogenate dehydrogenase family protein [Candidatus Dormibacteraeota bacterium]